MLCELKWRKLTVRRTCRPPPPSSLSLQRRPFRAAASIDAAASIAAAAASTIAFSASDRGGSVLGFGGLRAAAPS